MALKAIKFTNEELTPLLEESKVNESEVGFVKSFLSGITRSLIENPEIYRSFGAYWWPLKELLIEHGIVNFGTNLEAETTELFRYEDEELTCCAAYAMQQTKLKENQFLSATNLLDAEGGDTIEYTLHDTKMEDLTVFNNFRKRRTAQ